jgi:hypothetical protein
LSAVSGGANNSTKPHSAGQKRDAQLGKGGSAHTLHSGLFHSSFDKRTHNQRKQKIYPILLIFLFHNYVIIIIIIYYQINIFEERYQATQRKKVR